MRSPRAEEQWAAACIANTLAAEVIVHDDGSLPSMHDLRIRFADRTPGAVEVTAAADPLLIQTWKLALRGGRWVVPDLVGGWTVIVKPATNIKRIQAELPTLLRTLETGGIRVVQPEVWWEPGPLDEAASSLGVLHTFQSGTDYPGSVYVIVEPGPERSGGAVPADGGPLIRWLATWFERPDKVDNLMKLAASGCDERHLFLIVPILAEAPFQVTDLLIREDAPLPDADPALPREVTHVWVASTSSNASGMRWAPDSGWSRFDKQLRSGA